MPERFRLQITPFDVMHMGQHAQDLIGRERLSWLYRTFRGFCFSMRHHRVCNQSDTFVIEGPYVDLLVHRQARRSLPLIEVLHPHFLGIQFEPRFGHSLLKVGTSNQIFGTGKEKPIFDGNSFRLVENVISSAYLEYVHR